MMNIFYTAATWIVPLVIAIVFHEVAHGWVANFFGDSTARRQGRLTFNPVRHVDPIGTLVVPGFLALSGAPIFGWAKPVPVIQNRLRNPRFHMMVVAFAGPAMNLILAGLAAAGMALTVALVPDTGSNAPAIGPVAGFIVANLFNFMLINIFLALFNLLPIPPFDGSHIVEGALPPPLARKYSRLRPFGFVLLLVLLVAIPMTFPGAGIVERIVLPPVEWAIEAYLAAFGLA